MLIGDVMPLSVIDDPRRLGMGASPSESHPELERVNLPVVCGLSVEFTSKFGRRGCRGLWWCERVSAGRYGRIVEDLFGVCVCDFLIISPNAETHRVGGRPTIRPLYGSCH